MTPDLPLSRLARERRRLFGEGPAAAAQASPSDAAVVAAGSDGPVCALMLELARPAAWRPLATVWQGVQAELGLPAPAIAVNGRDGLQLWWALAEPVEAARGRAWLEAIRQRWLAALPAPRVAMQVLTEAPPVPERIGADGPWSAFVAPDLAPLFEETPWLDLPPTEEGQGELLARVVCVPPDAFDASLRALGEPVPAVPQAPPVLPPGGSPAAAQSRSTAEGEARAATVPRADGHAGAADESTGGSASRSSVGASVPGTGVAAAAQPAAPHPRAERFLLQVMDDPSAPLALRIEAARALLPWGTGR